MLDVLAGGEKEPWLDSGPSGKSHLHPQEKQPLSAVCVCGSRSFCLLKEARQLLHFPWPEGAGTNHFSKDLSLGKVGFGISEAFKCLER